MVVAFARPHPLGGGPGCATLASGRHSGGCAGTHDRLAEQAWLDNIRFFSRMVRKRPWVRMPKMAGSLDGRTALDNGNSQWIAGEAARVWTGVMADPCWGGTDRHRHRAG